MSGNSTYYPVVGVAGYPIAPTAGITDDKKPPVMDVPNPYQQFQIEEGDTNAVHGDLTVSDGLIKVTSTGGDGYIEAMGYNVFCTHVPGKKVQMVCTYQNTSGYTGINEWAVVQLPPSYSGVNVATQPSQTLLFDQYYYRYRIKVGIFIDTWGMANLNSGDFIQLQFSLVDA